MTRSGIRLDHLRGVLAALAIIDLLSFYFFIGEARERALGSGASIGWFAAVLSPAPVRALVIVIGIAGAVAFARAAGQLVAGLLSLVSLMLLSSIHAQLFGSPFRHMYYSGLCLLGWLAGLTATRLAGRPFDESYARIGSIALLGAAYMNAAISKVAFAGFEWGAGAPIQAVIVAQDGLVRDSIVSAYRSWVVMSPAVVGLFSIATMAFELAGPLMVLDGAARVIVALGLLGMHLNIYVLTGILYWQSMVLLVVLGVLPHDETPERRAAPLPMLASRRGFIGTVVALAVAALFAIGHQQRRYYAWRAAPNSPPAPVAAPVPTPLPSRTPPARSPGIGPFSVGDRLTDEWSIVAVSPTDGGFAVTLLGPPGRARFEVDCTPAEHHSPFDVGPAHVFYPLDMPFPTVEPVGNALRERLQRAAEPYDPCHAVNDWTHSNP